MTHPLFLTPDEFELLRRRYTYALARGESHDQALLTTARLHRLSLTETDHHLGDPRRW